MSSRDASSKQKQASASASASAEPSLRVSLLSSHAANLLSNANVILCTREDLYSFLTASPTQQADPARRPTPTVAVASPLPESLQATMEDDEDEDDAMSDTSSSLQSTSHKILKPDGEAGRPGRGGYNLADQLAWDDATFRRLKKFVHSSIKKHLDTTKCKSHQKKKSVKLVVLETCDAFPDLDDYAGYWPVQDLIKMRLKYTSRRARLFQHMEAGDVPKGSKGRSV